MSAQEYPSVATYLGASLITLVIFAHTYPIEQSLSPTLLIVAVFFVVCLLLPRRLIFPAYRKAVAVSGVCAARTCHVLISLV